MKIRHWTTLLGLGFLIACNTIQVRPDANPAPVDPSIDQARLEFSGCGSDSQLGTIACLPGQALSIVTEFPGDVIYFSADQTCNIRQQVRATQPLTALVLPATLPKICDVTILYVPEYLPQGQPTQQIYGLFGEVSLQPDAAYQPLGNFSIAVDQTLTLQFPGALHGVYIGRQLKDPVDFTGDTLTFKPVVIGTDLIQVKLFMKDGTVAKHVIPGNYFSPTSISLLFDITTASKGSTLKFPQEVSVVTVTGKKPTSQLSISLNATFTGYVRAYTAKGRTVVAYFENGALQWQM